MKLRNAYMEAYSLQPVCEQIKMFMEGQTDKQNLYTTITNFFKHNNTRTKAL